MQVADEDWLRCFGTSDSQLEPIPKLGKIKLTRAQLESQMVIETAAMFREKPVKPTRSGKLFD